MRLIYICLCVFTLLTNFCPSNPHLLNGLSLPCALPTGHEIICVQSPLALFSVPPLSSRVPSPRNLSKRIPFWVPLFLSVIPLSFFSLISFFFPRHSTFFLFLPFFAWSVKLSNFPFHLLRCISFFPWNPYLARVYEGFPQLESAPSPPFFEVLHFFSSPPHKDSLLLAFFNTPPCPYLDALWLFLFPPKLFSLFFGFPFFGFFSFSSTFYQGCSFTRVWYALLVFRFVLILDSSLLLFFSPHQRLSSPCHRYLLTWPSFSYDIRSNPSRRPLPLSLPSFSPFLRPCLSPPKALFRLPFFSVSLAWEPRKWLGYVFCTL